MTAKYEKFSFHGQMGKLSVKQRFRGDSARVGWYFSLSRISLVLGGCFYAGLGSRLSIRSPQVVKYERI